VSSVSRREEKKMLAFLSWTISMLFLTSNLNLLFRTGLVSGTIPTEQQTVVGEFSTQQALGAETFLPLPLDIHQARCPMGRGHWTPELFKILWHFPLEETKGSS
jgi:hypothetical protein